MTQVKNDRLREVVLLFSSMSTGGVEPAETDRYEQLSPSSIWADDAMFEWAEHRIGEAVGVPISRATIISLCGIEPVNPETVVALLHDVTRQLATSCDRFRATLENINQGVFMYDKDAKLAVWNTRSSILLGLPDGFLRVGISLEEMARFNAARGEYEQGNIDGFVKHIIDGGENPVEHRFERTRPNGTIIEVFGKPLPYGGCVSTFTDITERKKAELAVQKACDELVQSIEDRTRELRETQERFRQMLDSSTDWYWETDTEHRFTYVSDRYFNLTGLRPEEVIGHKRWELRGVKTIFGARDAFASFQQDLNGHRPFRNVDYVVRLKNGDEMIVRTSGQPFFSDDEEFLGYRGTATDATMIVAAHQELLRSERFAALGGMVAGVAHEINTPIGVGLTAATYLEEKTKSFSNLLSSGDLKKSDLEAFVGTVGEVSRSLSSNLRRAALQVKSFKQVAVDQSSNAYRRFNLADYIEEILDSLAPRLKRIRHSVRVGCPADLIVSCNPGAISQILTNLIINSLVHGFEHKDCGSIHIDVSTDRTMLSLIYEDDGKGVPVANLRSIFQPFFTTKRGKGGSGLGLHGIYNLVTQSMGGRIQFRSEEGEGVRVCIQIPDIICLNKNKKED